MAPNQQQHAVTGFLSLPREIRQSILRYAASSTGQSSGPNHRLWREVCMTAPRGPPLSSVAVNLNRVCRTINEDMNYLIYSTHWFGFSICRHRPHTPPYNLAFLPLLFNVSLNVNSMDFRSYQAELDLLKTFYEVLKPLISRPRFKFRFSIANPTDLALRRRWAVAIVLKLREHEDVMSAMTSTEKDMHKLKFVIDLLKTGDW